MTRIAIIIGSTRPGRKSESIARWVEKGAARRDDAEFVIVDLADHDLPHLDEPVAAAMSNDYSGGPRRSHPSTATSSSPPSTTTPRPGC
jgi:NAD(P)H-dependent FMN reductase